MKVALALTVILAALTAYYVYIPLPSTVSEPWKLMLLDAVFRSIVHVGNLANALGLTHYIRVLNYTVTLDTLGPVTTGDLRVTDTNFDGVEVRVYEWMGGEEGEAKRGVVYIHGGGWALGSTRMGSYDVLCRQMSVELKAVIVSVEYRLAPDVRFPVQYNDVLLASKHFLQPQVLARYSVDPDRVGVSGDSAGGNLAAAVAQQVAMDSSIPVKFKVQALIYPVLQALDFNTPSYQQNQEVPILYRTLMIQFWLEYLDADPSFIHPMLVNNHTSLDLSLVGPSRAKVDWEELLPAEYKKDYRRVAPARGTPRVLEEVPALLDPRAAPLLAEQDVLARTPRAYVLTCEHDVLRDDGAMYVHRLEEAGVPVEHAHFADGFHGCMTFAFWPTHFAVGARTLENYVAWLGQNL
ncbi:neutral cholesterol ester hydrolase 1a [Megalops cyprinoides]|uniref:neutral cholesterol ester hydrolase 1a n=1 Tax=Megalops cyprinoides TaxID=118141 RepID=UPI0018640332|nr:neutral cholesterol ester hydrolase 1a [Megalops cyprinoides]XP_036410113.1 neutral cholesterol ester hydrolase 1a [Megalops cyprinoides]